jgi:hypothetical protein
MKILVYIIPVLLALTVRADDITLADGKTVFHKAKIISQDSASVMIKHSTGLTRVMIPDLPPELRAQFKYDPEEATKVLQREQRTIAETNVAAAREIAESAKRDAEEPITVDKSGEKSEVFEIASLLVRFDHVAASS